MKKILLLDNYDSFTYNLLHLIEKVSDCSVDVIKNDKIDLDRIGAYSRIVLSPGPGLPSEAGLMPELIKQHCTQMPMLGVCLGMQALAENFGCKLLNLQHVVHGLAVPLKVEVAGTLFRNCPTEFLVGRYHSWVVDKTTLNPDILVTARDPEGNIMSIQHRTLNICGVQFHPESILSEYGEQVLQNWLTS